ncbi:MAG: hypothetical protein KIS95_06055 [Anaerolineae bacterium]|uniref:hypothetical protein n=1 Tax=Promineifilum sp. TaxID=2664178 RepID=UPI001D1D3FA4|nr:hypothetical protein [Anaerolineales bacterium]MCB8934308.1 hypothetical protein [Promineifilum sp.]MCO5179644.1 hypothetical protein [Promineifilum sp.]MCW5846771.1 hypothetical protein [Anaerolineae bacterium]
MASPLFIWLGSGRTRRRRIGPKGLLLDQAAHAGLPVPAGAVLTDELLRRFIEKGLVESYDGRLIAPDPELLHNTLFLSVRLPRFARPVALRAAFTPPAVSVPARLNVDLNDAIATTMALTGIWTGATRPAPGVRADVLVMDMVAVEHAGTALTGHSPTHDAITLHRGAEALTLAPALPRLGRGRQPDAERPPFARRLQMLLRGVRRTFGPGLWQIDWIDDGHICYLIQLSEPAEVKAQA